MLGPRPILHRALLCAVLTATPAPVAAADGAAAAPTAGPAPAVSISLPAGGQDAYT